MISILLLIIPSITKGSFYGEVFRFAIVTDNDYFFNDTPNFWKSNLKFGSFIENENGLYDLIWEGDKPLTYRCHRRNNRSMELSELVAYHGKLYGFCDMTGIMFEITKDLSAVPIQILFGGNGLRFPHNINPSFDYRPYSEKKHERVTSSSELFKKFDHLNSSRFTHFEFPSLDDPSVVQPSYFEYDKFYVPLKTERTQSSSSEFVVPQHCDIDWKEIPAPQKTEWATVKDDLLYVGSTGREWITREKMINHYDMEWVNILAERSTPNPNEPTIPMPVYHSNFSSPYTRMRLTTGTQFPGYLLHESAVFDEAHREWIFLPKHESFERYDEIKDECAGSNTLLVCSENFTSISTSTLGPKEPAWGVSSFRLLPQHKLSQKRHPNRRALAMVKTTERGVGERRQLLSKVGIFDINSGESLLNTPVTSQNAITRIYHDETRTNCENDSGTNDDLFVWTNDVNKYEGFEFLEGTNLEHIRIWNGKIIDLRPPHKKN
ncbi:putative calcium activated nucleotidase 1 [Monocercomonoides exilis]|uniref:putative calcium activated nucleotidase 1 n=1 Tax=Monocercomonoides exilis TaxID=2049356 RepID=UPI0035596CE4|nr:putative calcium activated nucleotidase 1 [Monocercomonoides exilis]|eukprot:MONOS_11092.1-p1 / transcript=MONOS_11092.1 / gene=MONOS_11092 / organism=Monocercomonoides_exilis_PA203 / gene_product=calcium activated nucleotidase 1 / transcript_product=calcium activated nucleotidase 1 / location=Mono_scaffold00537:21321-23362(-) / protein_length=491 / sequence_SO=supercontig / SO=protein_coding / is_pseudo=false